MTARSLVSASLAFAGLVAAAIAIANERRMQRHRMPGVSYGAVTFRRDGGWQRSDLFTEQGLACQRAAARSGMIAVTCWVLALVVWVALTGPH
jgi:hypothetical protein